MIRWIGTDYWGLTFDKYKSNEYTLAEYCAIPFFNREIDYREVNDWGTEETTDVYLLFFQKDGNWGKWQYRQGRGLIK